MCAVPLLLTYETYLVHSSIPKYLKESWNPVESLLLLLLALGYVSLFQIEMDKSAFKLYVPKLLKWKKVKILSSMKLH